MEKITENISFFLVFLRFQKYSKEYSDPSEQQRDLDVDVHRCTASCDHKHDKSITFIWLLSRCLEMCINKLGLDFLFKNFRPVSNLPYVSKLTEKAVVDQFNDHIESNELLPENASASRRETALMKVQSDMFVAMDNQHVTLLVMLDLSAAFDTVNHEMLVNTIASRFGISGTVLDWFRSYLDGRKQRVVVNDAMSEEMHLNCGVPQGSCLGPVLFVIYISSLYDVISQHLPSVHGYADDYQLYIWFKPEPVSERESVKAMEMCVSDVRQWMLANRLMINDSKTEVMLVGTRQQLSKVSVEGIRVGDEVIASVSTVKNLGVYLDQNLKMDKRIAKLCNKSFYQLYKLKRIRKFFSKDAIETVVHAFITSNLDYCNSLFYGMLQHLIDRLQRIQNAAARVVLLIPRFDHIRTALFDLHWLPVKQRI